MSIEFVENDSFGREIPQHYVNAKEIVVVGIANHSLLKNLCPGHYAKSTGKSVDKTSRLEQLRNAPLFRELEKRNDLVVSAFMVDPYSSFAKERHREERPKNNNCRPDLVRAINTFRLLEEDVKTDGEISIRGKLQVHLLTSNPYVSYTHIRCNTNPREILFLGFLLREQVGSDCPKLRVDDDPERINAFTVHHNRLDSRNLFLWTDCEIEYKEKGGYDYDVFLCHNHDDKEEVRMIAESLRSRHGLLPWLDEAAIGPVEWENAIRENLEKTKCAAVCAGPHGFGFYQSLEIGIIRSRYQRKEKISPIPVILPNNGDRVSDPFGDFLSGFNTVDMSKDSFDESVNQLARIIKDANDIL